LQTNDKVEQITGKALEKTGQGEEILGRQASIRLLKNKENHHAGHNLDRHPDFNVSGGIAHMAAQPQLGLLPEWRVGPDPVDPAHPAAVGPHLVGRIDGSGLQSWVQELRLTGNNRKRVDQDT